MDSSTVILIEILAWPLMTIAIVVPAFIYFRKGVIQLLERVDEVKAFGVQISAHGARLDDISGKVDKIERLNRDVYSIIYTDSAESEAEKVRDEVWRYVAFITEKLPERSAYDLRRELNAFHLANMRVTVKELKLALRDAGCLGAESGQEQMDEEITPELVDGIMRFQGQMIERHGDDEKYWVDGVVGPHTWTELTSANKAPG